MNKEIVSKQFTLKWRDILKGLVMAVLTPALFVVQQSLDMGQLTFNWRPIVIAALSGGLAYLIKNFLEPSKIVRVRKLKKEPPATKEPLGI